MRLWYGNGAWSNKKARARLAEMDPKSVKKIAIIRHAALGDMVLTRPFIHECRRFFPNAKITLSLVSNYTRGAPTDLVDDVHVIYGKELKKEFGKREQIKKMRELGPQDLLFDLAATSRSFWLTKLTRATIKFGFPDHLLQRYVYYDVTTFRSDLRYEAEAMLDMLNLLGVKTAFPLRFDLPGDTRKTERPYIIYFTSASTPVRCWPAEHFAGLANRAAEAYPDHDHLILKGVAEWETIEPIMEKVTASNVMAYSTDTVEETISLIKGASLVIANDTGIRHLAVAAGTPTIGLFFVTEQCISVPFRYWPRYDIHEAAFNFDGSIPSVDYVYELLTKVLK